MIVPKLKRKDHNLTSFKLCIEIKPISENHIILTWDLKTHDSHPSYFDLTDILCLQAYKVGQLINIVPKETPNIDEILHEILEMGHITYHKLL